MQFSIWTNIFGNGFSFQLIPTTFLTKGFSQGHFISSLLLHHRILLQNSDLCVHSYTYFILYDGLICIVAILYIQIGPMKMASTDSDDHQRLLGLFIRTKYVKFIPGSFQWQHRFVGYLSSVPLVRQDASFQTFLKVVFPPNSPYQSHIMKITHASYYQNHSRLLSYGIFDISIYFVLNGQTVQLVFFTVKFTCSSMIEIYY